MSIQWIIVLIMMLRKDVENKILQPYLRKSCKQFHIRNSKSDLKMALEDLIQFYLKLDYVKTQYKKEFLQCEMLGPLPMFKLKDAKISKLFKIALSRELKPFKTHG